MKCVHRVFPNTVIFGMALFAAKYGLENIQTIID